MANSLVQRFRQHSGLQRLPIGIRLRLVFACVLGLMFLGSGISLWYLHEIRQQVERVSLVEQRMTAVLQIDNGVLNLMNQLYRAAERRQRDLFSVEASRLLSALRSETAWATSRLHGIGPDDERQRVILDSLESMLEALPARITSMIELARAEDWVALHARLSNEIDRTDDVVAALVSDINARLAEARRALLDRVQHAQARTIAVLAATGLTSILLAGLLGLVVTRSITRPLVALEAGTRELSEGKLGAQIGVFGNDELAHVAAAFNRTSTELQAMYAKVQNSEARFRSLIENASDFILIADRSGAISYASASSTRLLGSTSGPLQGRSLQDFVDPEEAARLQEILAGNESAGGNVRVFELRFRREDGSLRILEGLATDLLDSPNVAGIVINARDVTERHAAEQALREREEQLRQAQKLEAVGLLAGGVAHDFNNMLTVMNGYSAFLLESLRPGEPEHEYALGILEAGERAADLTRQLLAFGRKSMLRPEVLNLNDIVTEAGRLLRRLIGEDIELDVKLDPSLCGVEVDRSQIHQVLMNLSANARDAMPDGGKLTIATAKVVLHRPLVDSHVEIPPGRYAGLLVRDAGQGMDEATRQRVFEPFFTTKEQGKGTGLGLASVYGIVRQSGGFITVESSIGRGATFQIYLPEVDGAVEAAGAPAPAEVTAGTETILVVEDEAAVRRIASRSLRQCGYNVIEAADAREALEICRTRIGQIRLLLTDVVMPGMNGVELSKQLLALNPQLKVIYVSGYTDRVLLQHGELNTNATFFQKPYRPAQLAAKVREVLEA